MMTVTDSLILLSFLVSAVLALAAARSIINTALKTQLGEAIKEEKFEEAAKLRDEIRGLEKE